MTSGSDIPWGPARHGTMSMNSTSKVRDQAPAEIRKGPPEAGASQRTRVWVAPFRTRVLAAQGTRARVAC